MQSDVVRVELASGALEVVSGSKVPVVRVAVDQGGTSSVALPEVHIGTGAPTGDEVLWVDTDEPGPVYEQAGAVAAHESATDPHPQYLPLEGGLLQGELRVPLVTAGEVVLTSDTANPLAAVRKEYVDDAVAAAGGGIPEAPTDGKQYARQDGGWSEVAAAGGVSSVLARTDLGTTNWASTSSSAFAAKGFAVDCTADVEIIGMALPANAPATAGLRLKGMINQTTSDNGTISAVVGTTETVTPTATSSPSWTYAEFPSPVSLTAGQRYQFLTVVTNKTDTYAFPTPFPGELRGVAFMAGDPFDVEGSVATQKVAKADPRVGDAVDNSTGSAGGIPIVLHYRLGDAVTYQTWDDDAPSDSQFYGRLNSSWSASSRVLVLGKTDPVPPGTAVNTVIVRKEA